MQVATLAISITGGYMNNDGFAPHINVPHYGALADSPDAIVKTLRLQVRNGADWIKLYATGTTRHVNLENMEPLPQFNDDDIQLVVGEAARFGKPVAAHAYGGSAENRARIVLEILNGIRARCGESLNVGLRLSPVTPFRDT